MAAKPKAGKPTEGLERGDTIYARHPKQGAVMVKVLSVGAHGYQGRAEDGSVHKLHHDTYLGHKTRMLHTYKLVDEGADGVLVERQDGQRRFLRGQLPADDPPMPKPGPNKDADKGPLLDGLKEVLRKSMAPPLMLPPGRALFLKAGRWDESKHRRGQPKNRGQFGPGGGGGAPAQQSTAHSKPPSRPGSSTAPRPAVPLHKHGDVVRFRHGDVEGQGKIVASGRDGVTVEDENGREHHVRHEALLPPKKDNYPEKKPGQDDKSYLKEHAKSFPEVDELPEEHARFFNMTPDTQTIPIDQLVSTKTDAENEKGGRNAPKFMMASYHGKVAKRDPITVEKRPDGRYNVVDGNGTFTGAKAAGWKALPVIVVDGSQAETKPLFDDAQTAGLPSGASQPVDSPEAITKLTGEAQAQLQKWLDEGAGAAIKAGFEHMKVSPEDVDLDQPGKMLFIAPPKSSKRAAEKVASDYGGDWSKLLDPVRCSLACDTFDEVHETLKMLMASGMKLARKPKDRFTKPTEAGYRDCMLNVTLPNGLIGEVQLHTKTMLKAKAEGHKWYEVQRELDAKKQKSDISIEEEQKLKAAVEAQKQIYETAWQTATSGSSGKKPDMKKALDPAGGQGFTYFEYDNAYFRRASTGDDDTGHSINDVLHGDKWVPYKGDRLKPVTYGDVCEDPLAGGEGGDEGGGEGDIQKASNPTDGVILLLKR